jgi:hypothetical protein
VEVVKAMVINLWGFVHFSQVDLSAMWFSMTPKYFYILLKREKNVTN